MSDKSIEHRPPSAAMEESYAIHRRRKAAAAARRREKTPEPFSRRPSNNTEDEGNDAEVEDNEEEEEERRRRAKMERMAEEAEREREEIEKALNLEKARLEAKPKAEPRQKPKRKSRERVRSSDSSEMEDKSEGRVRSTERKLKPKRSSSKPKESRATSSERKSKESKESVERPLTTQRDALPEKEPKMKKSETFPQEEVVEPEIKRSSSEPKKQIIPLSNESLIEDFAKAQREYLIRERGILAPEPVEVIEELPKTELRRRKVETTREEKSEPDEIEQETPSESEKDAPKTRSSWFSWLLFWRRNKTSKEEESIEPDEKPEEIPAEKAVEVEEKPEEKVEGEKTTLMDFLRALKDVSGEFRCFVEQNPYETGILRNLRNRCSAELILMLIYCGLGAFVFRFTEGAFETFYKCGVKRVKRDFLDSLWESSHNMREEDWKSMARRKLMEFEEQLHTAHEAGVHTYSGQKSWSFLNAVLYCITVVTTIGYGHISPSTTTGRAITIVYAIFGIPMFLIILADFGKLFTRGIKFLWAFVRRLYYTGSCRKVRRTVPVQEVMKGVQLVYDFATFRRPSQMNPEDIQEMQKQGQTQTVLNLDGSAPGTPGTPAISAFAIDDEFNLPISVAIFILLGYIFVGATLYSMWESWDFFESFYFVFISMSTIGFGDYVPKHPIYMMCSIIYLVFGLALTSMCINVVQVMLSDSFRQASQKIGATIGFEVAEDDGEVKPVAPPPVEMADVHASVKDDEKVAPKAKQEDVDL